MRFLEASNRLWVVFGGNLGTWVAYREFSESDQHWVNMEKVYEKP
jgi:hypothetical protein